jgi:hypothetical protein
MRAYLPVTAGYGLAAIVAAVLAGTYGLLTAAAVTAATIVLAGAIIGAAAIIERIARNEC